MNNLINNVAWLNQFKLLALDEIDSTNLEAKRLVLSKKVCDYLVITAENQLAGRGRYGRKWESKTGNLFMSIILPRSTSIEVMAQLSFVCGLSVASAINELYLRQSENSCELHREVNLATCYVANTDSSEKYGSVETNSIDTGTSAHQNPFWPLISDFGIRLKWPNDVLIYDKKFCGILIETAGNNNEYIIVGIGVNINSAPTIQDYPTTSLHREGLNNTQANMVLNEIMSQFAKYYEIWHKEGFFHIRDKWMTKAKDLGKKIKVSMGKTAKTGKFMDIDENGKLRLQLENGKILTISAGEVFAIA